jgi:hypothetical protein
MSNAVYSNLKSYILRRLGSPVINVELTEDQIEDCIDDALEQFTEEHYDGVFTFFQPLTLVAGTTKYKLNDDVQSVLSIISSESLQFDYSGDEPLLLRSFWLGNEGTQLVKNTLVDVEVYRQQFKMYSDYFDVPIQFDYNHPTRTMHLYAEPKQNLNVFLRVYKNDEEELDEYLTNRWMKAYSTALARKQWGHNLMKYDGANLPGGAQFNHSEILAQAEADIERLLAELEEKYSLPIDPMVG